MTTPLKELVAEVELLAAQATDGPWYEEAASGDRNLITAIKSGDVGATDKWVDAVFVAALRTAWPDIVRGIDALQAERDALMLDLDTLARAIAKVPDCVATIPVQVPDVPALVEIAKRRTDRIAKLESLAEAAKDAAIHSVNFDTCGVCGKHFPECESEVWTTSTDTGFGDIEGFECAGARLREALAALEGR